MKTKELKILHIINELGMGGAEILLTESMPIYKQMLVDVDLCVLQERENCIYTKEAKEINPGKIIVLGSKTFKNPLLILKIIPLLKKYDIVHSHLFPTLYWVALAKIISFSKTKLVFTEHNTTNKRMSNSFFRLIDQILYKNYDKIVTISCDVDLAIKNHLKFKNKMFTKIENGINLQKIYNGIAYKKEDFFQIEDCKIIMQVSSFKDQKDQDTLIKALEYLDEKYCLLLVGEGTRMQECKFLVDKLKLSNRVRFLGNRSDIPSLLKTADFIILSTFYEGLSLASIEGMASGKPFIASDAPGLRDVVIGAGLLFPIGDEKKLAAIIKNLVNDKNFYCKTVSNCLLRAKEFDIEKMVDNHIDLYQKLKNIL